MPDHPDSLDQSLVFDHGLNSSFGSLAESIADNLGRARKRETKTWEDSLVGLTVDNDTNDNSASKSTLETEDLSEHGSSSDNHGSGSSVSSGSSRKSRRQNKKVNKYKTLLHAPKSANQEPPSLLSMTINKTENKAAEKEKEALEPLSTKSDHGSRCVDKSRLPRKIKSESSNHQPAKAKSSNARAAILELMQSEHNPRDGKSGRSDFRNKIEQKQNKQGIQHMKRDRRDLLTKAVSDFGSKSKVEATLGSPSASARSVRKLNRIRMSVAGLAASTKKPVAAEAQGKSMPNLYSSLSNINFSETSTLVDRLKQSRNGGSKSSGSKGREKNAKSFHKSSSDIPSFFDWEKHAAEQQ